MYTSFYNLRERPFNLTPDSHFLYLSPRHREALGHLLYGIRERKGFILVTGEVGTGKTTLCRALIAEIEKEAEVGFILNSFLSAEELLRTINEDLSCHAGAVSRKGLVDELLCFYAPIVLGGDVGASGKTHWPLPLSPRFRLVESRPVGGDLFARFVPDGEEG